MKNSILVVEDEKIVRISLMDALKAEGYAVLAVGDGREGINAMEDGEFSVIITDIRLPGVGGMDILRKCLLDSPQTPVIMMTAFGSIKDAVEAMRNGAFDYITKPFDLDEMLITVHKALEVQSLTQENIRLKRELSNYYSIPNIIGESKAMQSIFALLEKVSRTDSTVLIRGESGTGKELIASLIHYHSSRKNKPIIRVNCAALPDDLIESELFGYEKGAFTGADKRKPGRFDRADGGSIFLDEIGDLPFLTQTKILRVLEERNFERLGATETVSVNVRIIAATNKNLEEEIVKKTFREDLYYRLNVIPIVLPPLRKRREDIPLLINSFTSRFNDQMGTDVTFGTDAIQTLMNYAFPGNVRELLNIVERSVALASNKVIGRADLPPHIAGLRQEKTALQSLRHISAEAEKKHIVQIMKLAGGSRSKAAEILGVSRKTLWEKINTYKLDF